MCKIQQNSIQYKYYYKNNINNFPSHSSFLSFLPYSLLQKQLLRMATMPTTFNPSDYQFLLKSVNEGNLVSKAQSLKRLNALVLTDKKQFSIYAKRVVISIQDLLTEPKEDVNLLASTLGYQIINLNPREIQFYIRTKLLKNMVRNLGDSKPQIRKTSHYCLLAYVKTYKTFDELIQVYINYGFESDTWQLRQKSINSFQSILIMEMKYLNWSSPQFKKIVEELLTRCKDQSQYVQKAAQQCLVSICKYQQVKNFSKKLPSGTYNALKQFNQNMLEQGMLQQIKLYVPELPPSMIKNFSSNTVHLQPHSSRNVTQKNLAPLNLDKIKVQKLQAPHTVQMSHKQAILTRIQDLRKKTHTPLIDKQAEQRQRQKQRQRQRQREKQQQRALKKAQSVSIVSKRPPTRDKSLQLPLLRKSIQIQQAQVRANLKSEKNQMIGRKLIDDLRNQKDWKVRLQAIQQLQTKFNASKGTPQAESMAKNFLHVLIRLLGDPNFKVALIALKIIQQILLFQNMNQSPVVPQLVQKITDGKIALRQNISKLIRGEFSRTGNKIWLIQLVNQLKKSPAPNSNIKQQIINIISKITLQAQANQQGSRMQTLCLCLQQIIQAICPLMDDLKTKIKIKTLDLLILLSIKTNNTQMVKSILASKLNQVYFQMYIQKVAKQLKNVVIAENQRGTTAGDRRNRLNSTNRRYNKGSGNTTSSTLRKYSSVEAVDQHNSSVKTALFTNRNAQNYDKVQQDSASVIQNHKDTQPSTSKKTIIKSYRKKNFDYKSTQYSAFSAPGNSSMSDLPPFNDPQKQLKNILIQIKSQQWQTCSQALTKLRRIIQNHMQLLTSPIIRVIVPEIIKLVQSLRSNLSKNAVITLNDLSNKLTKVLDPDLDSIFTKLLKKTLDANSFISQEVRRALISICSNCNESRVVTLLFNSHTSRAVPIKVSIVNVIQSIVFLPRVYERELQRIVNILVNFLGEGSLQIRQKSKAVLSSVLSSDKGEQIIKLIPSEHLHKLTFKQFKNTDKSQMRNNMQAENNNDKKQQLNQSRLNKKRKQKITTFPQQFEKMESLLQQCQSSDWKNRQKNMTLIYQTVIEPYPKQFVQHKMGGKVMDVLSKQIGDPNVKVASNALKILKQLPRKIPQIIQHNLSVLANEVFNCFGSHKPQIKSLAEQLFDQIAQNIQKWMLIQHMCNGALYGLQKSRPLILMRLIQILPQVYAKGNKKTLLSKNLYPLINKLAQQNKPENLEGLSALMRTCHEQTNGQFLGSLKPKAIQLYNSMRDQ